jgi:hypothetical protein
MRLMQVIYSIMHMGPRECTICNKIKDSVAHFEASAGAGTLDVDICDECLETARKVLNMEHTNAIT